MKDIKAFRVTKKSERELVNIDKELQNTLSILNGTVVIGNSVKQERRCKINHIKTTSNAVFLSVINNVELDTYIDEQNSGIYAHPVFNMKETKSQFVSSDGKALEKQLFQCVEELVFTRGQFENCLSLINGYNTQESEEVEDMLMEIYTQHYLNTLGSVVKYKSLVDECNSRLKRR